jgi:hypothetical protein
MRIPLLTRRQVQTAEEAIGVAQDMLSCWYRLTPPSHRDYAVRLGHVLDDVAYAVQLGRTELLAELRRHDEELLAARQGVLFVVQEGH